MGQRSWGKGSREDYEEWFEGKSGQAKRANHRAIVTPISLSPVRPHSTLVDCLSWSLLSFPHATLAIVEAPRESPDGERKLCGNQSSHASFSGSADKYLRHIAKGSALTNRNASRHSRQSAGRDATGGPVVIESWTVGYVYHCLQERRTRFDQGQNNV